MRHTFLLSSLLLLLFIQIVFAEIPQTMSYQAVLGDVDGNPVPDGNYQLTFRITTNPNNSTILWEEVHDDVAVTSGLFHVILGSITSLNLPFDQPYYLGIQVGDEPELMPRIELSSSPYSLNARAIADSVVTSGKIAQGQVVRSLNQLREDI